MFPIADELNLPEKHYSYLLQNWNQLLAVDSNFDKARETLEKILGINLWTKQSEEINQHAAESVNEFYESNPETEQTQPILVVEADGKGVVIRKEPQEEKPTYQQRLKKGEKKSILHKIGFTAIFADWKSTDILAPGAESGSPQAGWGLRMTPFFKLMFGEGKKHQFSAALALSFVTGSSEPFNVSGFRTNLSYI